MYAKKELVNTKPVVHLAKDTEPGSQFFAFARYPGIKRKEV
jgi:hypothetical protein